MEFHTLWRGFQSAVFYYVSCTPYFAYASGRKRDKQNARYRAEREAFERVVPPSYRQPSPYRTNAYWAEEIRLGPQPPPRKTNKKQRAARLKAMSQASTVASAAAAGKRTPGVDRGSTPAESSLELAGLDGIRGPLKPPESAVAETERWKLNQREDEDLWGAAVYPGSATSEAAAGPGNRQSTLPDPFPVLPGLTGRLAAKETFKPHSNPPVNDLHPPVVSNPAFSSGSNMWMLQPPPPAAIMKGYDSPSNNRSRSTTASSGTPSSHRGGSSTAASSTLGRRLSQRLVEEKLRRGEMLYPNDLRRPPSSWTENPDALKIEAKYYEEASSGQNRHDRLPDSSSEPVVRSPDSKFHPSLAPADGKIKKADSGVEMKQVPGTNGKTRNDGTQRQDFAFPHRFVKPNIDLALLSTTAPSKLAKDRNIAVLSSNKALTGMPVARSHRQTKSVPKRIPLSRVLSSPDAAATPLGEGEAQCDTSISSLNSNLDQGHDADDEDDDDDDEDIEISRYVNAGRGVGPHSSQGAKFKGQLVLPHTVQPPHPGFIRERRWSVP